MKYSQLIAASVIILGVTASLTATTVRSVAFSYVSTPVFDKSFSLPVISNSGMVAFLNGLQVNVTSPSSYDDGLRAWSEASGSLEFIAGMGDSLPNLPSLTIGFFNQFGFNETGNMVLRTSLEGPGVSGTTNFATYLKTSTGLHSMWRRGDPAPGLSNSNFGALSYIVLNNSDQVAFRCNVTNISSFDNDSIWRGKVGQLDLAAKAGTFPGTNTGTTFREPVLNDDGIVALSVPNSGIWVGQPGNMQAVALGTDVAPGTPSQTFGSLLDPVINSFGHVAFFSSLDGGGSGIWSNRAGALSLIARTGEQAPSMPEGVQFLQPTVPVLNDVDRVLFRGSLATGGDVTTANDTGLWSDTSGALQLVIREGDVAPGTSSGVLFGQFDTNSHVLNADNQIAFLGRLTGTDVTTANDVGIWATDSTGEIQLIAREGNPLEVSPGDTRTIKELMFFSGTGNADSRPSGFNDAGQLAYWARFTDNSEGLFVSYAVAESIPGDFNHDSRVDAADYVTWRKTDGTQLGYNTWRTHFGRTLPPAGVGTAVIPEPATTILAIICLAGIIYRTRLRLAL
jgi:hypothetical protein